MLPTVRRAMTEVSAESVVLDDLMAKAGERIAALLGAPAALVTSGAPGALTAATCACVAGGDPELAVQLPDVDGMPDEVVMPIQSRSVFDQTIRATGVRLVTIDLQAELRAAVGPRTALLTTWAGAEHSQSVTPADLVSTGRENGVPVVVDAAAELPGRPNRWLAAGADLVCYSGGKILQGPQGAGLLLGRADLVNAAWMHCAPHGTFGRMMKVSKEEIVGMLTAVEYLVGDRDLEGEIRCWRGWYTEIATALAGVDGVATELRESGGRSPYPILIVAWDSERLPLTAADVGHQLRTGTPPILSHAPGEGCEFMIRPLAMAEGDQSVAARRLVEIFADARARTARSTPSGDIDGQWKVDISFVAGSARHRFSLTCADSRISGQHMGRRGSGAVTGTLNGAVLVLRSVLLVEGARLTYLFEGSVDTTADDLTLGEELVDGFGVGRVTWSARRLSSVP